jgi:hypothetical protein
MIDPTWILIGIGFISLLFGTPTFYRELREIKARQNSTQKRHPGIVIGALSILVLLAWMAVAFDYYDRHFAADLENFKNWTTVQGLTYSHETVLLDGKEFINCHFDNVLFQWNATAPTRLTDVTITGPETKFISNNIIVSSVQLLIAGMMKAMGQNMPIIARPKTP